MHVKSAGLNIDFRQATRTSVFHLNGQDLLDLTDSLSFFCLWLETRSVIFLLHFYNVYLVHLLLRPDCLSPHLTSRLREVLRQQGSPAHPNFQQRNVGHRHPLFAHSPKTLPGQYQCAVQRELRG
jgi:hypothetical protein